MDATKGLDVMGCSMDSGATIDLWEYYQNGFQKFQIKRESDGYNITNTSSGKSLDIVNGSSAAGANVQQWQTNYTNAQRWYFEDEAMDMYISVQQLETILM